MLGLYSCCYSRVRCKNPNDSLRVFKPVCRNHCHFQKTKIQISLQFLVIVLCVVRQMANREAFCTAWQARQGNQASNEFYIIRIHKFQIYKVVVKKVGVQCYDPFIWIERLAKNFSCLSITSTFEYSDIFSISKLQRTSSFNSLEDAMSLTI